MSREEQANQKRTSLLIAALAALTIIGAVAFAVTSLRSGTISSPSSRSDDVPTTSTESLTSEPNRVAPITWTHVATELNAHLLDEFQVTLAQSSLATSTASDSILSIETADAEGDWALLGYTYRERGSGEYVGTGGLVALLHRTSDEWELAPQGSPTFCTWVRSAPPQLFGEAFPYYRTQICDLGD